MVVRFTTPTVGKAQQSGACFITPPAIKYREQLTAAWLALKRPACHQKKKGGMRIRDEERRTKDQKDPCSNSLCFRSSAPVALAPKCFGFRSPDQRSFNKTKHKASRARHLNM